MPIHIKVEPASYRRTDTELLLFLPPNSNDFITSRFNWDELKEAFEGQHCLWIEILNRSFEDNISFLKKHVSWLSCGCVVEPKHLKFKHVPMKKKRERKRQLGGFLKRYDFAYAGRDVANQAGKLTPG